MATITPIELIPDYDKNQLQQILLERDESVERALAIINQQAIIDSQRDLIKEAYAARDAALNMMASIRHTIGASIDTDDMKALKKAEAEADLKKAQDEAARQQAIIDSIG